MRYILSQDEMDALVPKTDLLEVRDAINLFHDVFIGSQCIHHPDFSGMFKYCDHQCPLGKLPRELRDKMCNKPKRWGQ